MNYSMIFYLLGWSLNIQAVLMLFPSAIAFFFHENALFDFLLVMVLCLAIGLPLTRKRPKNDTIYAREGFVAVAMVWVVLSLFGSLPFIITGEIPRFIDALFETVSGFSTTGASILTDVESLSKSIMFWRSFTHWIGGMGVLVLLLAILPLAGGHNFNLVRAESPGPSVSKLTPKLRESALILYLIYLGMSILQFVLLLIAGMGSFNALLTTFGTAGTGGFGFSNDSMTSQTPTIQAIISIFMLLFGVNFTVYYLIITKKFKQALKSEELRVYLAIILVSTTIIVFNIRDMFSSFAGAAGKAFFQVSTIITTTGYSTDNFDLWPVLSKSILVLLMFIGASAGSTGGGLKVSRVVVWVKNFFRELRHTIHPRSVKTLTFEGRPLTDESVKSIGVYLVAYLLIFVFSVIVTSIDGLDMTTNFTAVASALNNIGPGLAAVGPNGSFAVFSDLSKSVLIFDMIAGRLELFPILLLLSPGTWKK